MTGPEAGAKMATGGEVPTRASTYELPFFSTPEAEDRERHRRVRREQQRTAHVLRQLDRASPQDCPGRPERST